MFDRDEGQQCGNNVAGMVPALVFAQRTIQGLVADKGESQCAKHRDEEALGYARKEQQGIDPNRRVRDERNDTETNPDNDGSDEEEQAAVPNAIHQNPGGSLEE